jgi:hypothetical protein
MILAVGDHWAELADATRSAAPILIAALLLSAVIFGVLLRPPERIRADVISSRRQLLLVGAAIPLGALSGFFVLYWML